MIRHAACSCGQLHLTIEGEPSRNAMCHCLACQRRTGAVISNQARFRNDQVTVSGKSTEWKRTAESGNAMTFHFCPTCRSTVFWENAGFPGLVSVAIGNFVDPRSVGDVAPPVGSLASRHAAEALGQAEMTRSLSEKLGNAVSEIRVRAALVSQAPWRLDLSLVP
jgi:hypothetical protein